jgi:hypothetical protein
MISIVRLFTHVSIEGQRVPLEGVKRVSFDTLTRSLLTSLCRA